MLYRFEACHYSCFRFDFPFFLTPCSSHFTPILLLLGVAGTTLHLRDLRRLALSPSAGPVAAHFSVPAVPPARCRCQAAVREALHATGVLHPLDFTPPHPCSSIRSKQDDGNSRNVRDGMHLGWEWGGVSVSPFKGKGVSGPTPFLFLPQNLTTVVEVVLDAVVASARDTPPHSFFSPSLSLSLPLSFFIIIIIIVVLFGIRFVATERLTRPTFSTTTQQQQISPRISLTNGAL
eukprot:gene12936-8792_t